MARIRGTFYLRGFGRHALVHGMLLSLVCLASCQKTDSKEGVKLAKVGRIKVNVFRPAKTENASKRASYFGKLKPNRSQTLGFSAGGKLIAAPESQQRFSSGATIATLETGELASKRQTVERELANIPAQDRDSDLATQLKLQLSELDRQIEQRSILAPFDCIVERLFSSPNSLVRPGSPVVSVVETTAPKIEINLPKHIVKLIEFEQNYVFVLDGERLDAVLRERSFTESPPGTVRAVFDIKSSLSQIDFYLEQPVEARFSFPTGTSGHWLPMSCLQQNSDGQWNVLVIKTINERNEVRQLPVEIAQIQDDSVFVTSDLESQFLIRDGIHRVVPGQRVDLNLVPLEESIADTSVSE